MKFAIVSDLHMEFQPWLHEPIEDAYYLNAGDTHPSALMRDYFHHNVLKDKVFWIKGNHDYYGHSFRDSHLDIPESQTVGGLKIVGATLWTDVTPARWWDFKEYMMDVKHVGGMTYDRYMLAHKTHRKYLFESNADIWVIHHLPSWLSVHPDYIHSNGNDFFATELREKILEMKNPPKLIVHGHTHRKCDYMIGNTRVLCHPRGYPNENDWYNNYEPLIVEL